MWATSLMLAPHGMLSVAQGGMLSIDGRCKTFDEHANGYLRSEDVSALLVGRGERTCGASVGGSVVRQGGRSVSLTAPNDAAQRALLCAALGRRACVTPEVGCIEAPAPVRRWATQQRLGR